MVRSDHFKMDPLTTVDGYRETTWKIALSNRILERVRETSEIIAHEILRIPKHHKVADIMNLAECG
jgi:hypothetical protein